MIDPMDFLWHLTIWPDPSMRKNMPFLPHLMKSNDLHPLCFNLGILFGARNKWDMMEFKSWQRILHIYILIIFYLFQCKERDRSRAQRLLSSNHELASLLLISEACVAEILRIACTAPFTIDHRATQDTQINGYKIPKDTLVCFTHASSWTLQLLCFWAPWSQSS